MDHREDGRYTALERRGDDEGWIVKQKGRSPASRWFSIKKHGEATIKLAEECEASWDREVAKALLVPKAWMGECSDCSRYSLGEARKCEESEAQALLGKLARLNEGEAEWARRQAAA